MFDKASPVPIVRDHLATLRDHATGRRRPLDLLLFLGAPAAVAAGATYLQPSLSDTTLMATAVAGALLTGLLLNFLPSLARLARTEPGDHNPLRERLIADTIANTSFAALTATLMLAAALAHLAAGCCNPATTVLTAMVHLAQASLLLNALMILRRTHVLYRQETEHLIRRNQEANPPEPRQEDQP